MAPQYVAMTDHQLALALADTLWRGDDSPEGRELKRIGCTVREQLFGRVVERAVRESREGER